MILDLVNKLIKPITIIALISIITTWAFNIENTLITSATYNGIEIKVFHFRTYLTSLSNAWETTALDFRTIIPPRQFDSNWSWSNIGNNLALLFDWLYFPINFILYILRWGAWLFKLLLAIIGWNVGTDIDGNYYSMLAEILSWITQNLFIPYI